MVVMIDFDKMTVAEHEQYKEMQRKARLYDKLQEDLERFNTTVWMSDRQFITHLFNFYEGGDQS